jgi:hypothetical protein
MGAQRLSLNAEMLDEEYNLLKNELDDLDEMFEETSKTVKELRKYPSRQNPVIMSSQTTNLITIKDKKISIIKELINIKKAKIDIKAKEFNYNNKLDEVESGVSKEILEIYRLLNKNDKSILIQESLEDNKEEPLELTDEEIDKVFEERLGEAKEEYKEKKKKEQVLPDEYHIVVTKNKEFFIVDEDYNIIDDIEYDTSVIDIKEFYEENGEELAKDTEGHIYEVVEL